MVPDVQSFPEGVADINLASHGYRIEVADSDNALLEVDEEVNEEEDTKPNSLMAEDLTDD
jgi:hypothetical protein